MLPWKNSVQVKEQLRGMGDELLRVCSSLFSLSLIIERSLPSADFDAPDGLADCVPFSSHGIDLLKKFPGTPHMSRDQQALAMLEIFYHRDFLIDVAKIQLNQVIQVISKLVSNKKLRFANRFGRQLYDRFNSHSWGDRLEFLSADLVDELIGDTQTGVYQISNLIVGPLGILPCADWRLIPPSRKVPLWHCSDIGYGAIHSVELLRHQSAYIGHIDDLRHWLTNCEGQASEWVSPLISLFRKGPKAYFNLLAFLADAFDEVERDEIFKFALTQADGKKLRAVIPTGATVDLLKGSAEQIAKRLPDEAKLQLLATLSDSELVFLIDKCVYSGLITIPTSEVRSSQFLPPHRGGDSYCELSSLGIRSARKHPPLFLSRMVYNAYHRETLLSDLAWKCGVAQPSPATVLKYLQEHGPKKAIEDLVIPSRAISDYVCSKLMGGELDQVNFKSEVNILLWKAGFNPARYETKYENFRRLLGLFKEVVLQTPTKHLEADREQIRSAGVNVFVYAEHFLEELIAYNIWLMSSDHFYETGFDYSLDLARASVPKILPMVSGPDGELVAWKEGGGNTLGPLLAYGRAAANWFAGLVAASAAEVRRPAELFPHFASANDKLFPFRHTQFWADVNPDALSNFVSLFEKLITLLEQSRIAEVRNGLQHHREISKFPQIDAILSCEARLTSCLDLADVNRLLPKAFWMNEKHTSEYGVSECVMRDYLNRPVSVCSPQIMNGLVEPSFGKAFLIPPSDLLGAEPTRLLFKLHESSRYRKRWENYPQRNSNKTNKDDGASGDFDLERASEPPSTLQ